MSEQAYEVWFYMADTGEYDGCCGHQHDEYADARRCLRENPAGRGRKGEIAKPDYATTDLF